MGTSHPMLVVKSSDIQALFDVLSKSGYRILGPVLKDNAIVYDEISTVDDMPVGWSDDQEKGRYRLTKTNSPALFQYVLGPQNWKKYLFPPRRELWQATRNGHRFVVTPTAIEPVRQALIGVRSCDLHALAALDDALGAGQYADVHYRQARENAFIVAVNCTRPGQTCFCASLDTGPRATAGFDLLLTEIIEPGRHVFTVEIGSAAGAKVMKKVPGETAAPADGETVDALMASAASGMTRRIERDGLKDKLNAAFDDVYWEEVAERCLTCGNCTMVCPTCFCMTVEDDTSLDGAAATRSRRWDSCFTLDFSYIHGGSIRVSESSRYRQWVMHKLAHWQDQFGTLGCVGCGRCITWCPVGIDITETARTVCKYG